MKSLCLHGVESFLRTLYPETDMRQSATAAVALDEFLHRRFGAERFQKLYEIRAIPDLKQDLAHLIGPMHLFAMNFPKTQQLEGVDLAFQFALFDRDRDMVHKLDFGNVFQCLEHSTIPLLDELSSHKLDQDLIHFYRISLSHPDSLDFSAHSRGDIGLHFHGFEHHEKIIRLDLLAGLHIDFDDDTRHRTSADFLLCYVRLDGTGRFLHR